MSLDLQKPNHKGGSKKKIKNQENKNRRKTKLTKTKEVAVNKQLILKPKNKRVHISYEV